MRRAARERERAVRVAARAREEERRQRALARRRALTGWLPARGRRGRDTGVLAARRRRRRRTTVGLLVVLNVVVWVVSPAWEARTVFIMVSLLAAPVLHTLLFGRR